MKDFVKEIKYELTLLCISAIIWSIFDERGGIGLFEIILLPIFLILTFLFWALPVSFIINLFSKKLITFTKTVKILMRGFLVLIIISLIGLLFI